MLVKDLQKKLEKMNPNLHVYIPKKHADDIYQLAKKVKEKELGDLDDDSSVMDVIIIE